MINPAFPLRSALVCLLSRPECHRVSADELASVAGVALHRAKAFLTLVERDGAVVQAGGHAYPTSKWGYYVEETNGVSASKSRRKCSCLTSEQRGGLKSARGEAAEALARDCRRTRDFLGLTIPRLAKEAGLSITATEKVLKGDYVAPAFDIVLVTRVLGVDLGPHVNHLKSRICEALGVSVG